MIKAITINRRNPRDAAILDVLEQLKGVHGSVTNAAACCILDSPRFQEAQRQYSDAHKDHYSAEGAGENGNQ